MQIYIWVINKFLAFQLGFVYNFTFFDRYPLFYYVTQPFKMRQLKFHEKKLLKKVDFINWSLDNNVHQASIMRKYCIKKRQHVTLYNTLATQVWSFKLDFNKECIQIRELTKKVRDLEDKNPNKNVLARKLLGKLYDMGVIPTADTLERCDKITASSFCRRRLAVMMVKLAMVQTVSVKLSIIYSI